MEITQNPRQNGTTETRQLPPGADYGPQVAVIVISFIGTATNALLVYAHDSEVTLNGVVALNFIPTP